MTAEFPTSDDRFDDYRIDRAEPSGSSFTITCDGWSLFCGDCCPIEPQEGMVARLYGKGRAYMVRGLFIDGRRFFYRTEAEDKEYHAVQLYGADAADWLRRWDDGKIVWTIEMGGFGPGYEQCIHITAAEILRWLLQQNPDISDDGAWPEIGKQISADVTELPVIAALGLSGAQWGAALNVAAILYKRGPRAVMADEAVKDRHIQVQRGFPQGRA